jgi:uracil-DNA glycosylase family 4
VEAGFLPRANPIFSGHAGQRVLLVGQAPGPVEDRLGRPFAGRSGRVLMRWFQEAGFADEADVRQRVYMTSITTCFPGRRPDGSGDRRPTAAEVALCTPWLDALLDVLQPPLVVPVGGLAVGYFLPGRHLEEVVGRVLTEDGTEAPASPPVGMRLLVPLPHPSGQSRWLNDPRHLAQLHEALRCLAEFVPWAENGGRRRRGKAAAGDAILSGLATTDTRRRHDGTGVEPRSRG